MSDTPSRAMYEILKSSGIKMNEAAKVLLDMDFKLGPKTFRERVDDRTYLKRYIVDAAPGDIPERAFCDFAQSSMTLAGRMARHGGIGLSNAILLFSGEAVAKMIEALEAAGQSPHAYRNMASSIMRRDNIGDMDRLSLLVLLCVVGGCLGDSSRACNAVDAFSRDMLASGFHTEVAAIGEGAGFADEDVNGRADSIILLRKVGGNSSPRPYRLSEYPAGTVIGRNPSQEPSIDDVDDLVSANHLRVWRDEGGRWLAEGLGSTNGSVLVSGEDRGITVIEPPVNERSGWVGGPVEILVGDTIRLAGVTEFLVLA